NHSARSCGVVVESITAPTLFMKNVAPSATQWEIDSAKPSCTTCTAASATGAATPLTAVPTAPGRSPSASFPTTLPPAQKRAPAALSHQPFPPFSGSAAAGAAGGDTTVEGTSSTAAVGTVVGSVVCGHATPGQKVRTTAPHARVRLTSTRRRLAGRMGELLEVLDRRADRGTRLGVVSKWGRPVFAHR